MTDDSVLAYRMPATVVEVIDPYRVVINRGAFDGVKLSHRMMIYGLSAEPLIDPENGQDLGRLEIVRGVGRVTHVQDRMATISSTQTAPQSKRVVRRNSGGLFGTEEVETIQEGGEGLPFDDPKKGDFARLV